MQLVDDEQPFHGASWKSSPFQSKSGSWTMALPTELVTSRAVRVNALERALRCAVVSRNGLIAQPASGDVDATRGAFLLSLAWGCLPPSHAVERSDDGYPLCMGRPHTKATPLRGGSLPCPYSAFCSWFGPDHKNVSGS